MHRIFNVKRIITFCIGQLVVEKYAYARSTKSDYYYLPAAAALIIYLKIMYPWAWTAEIMG